MSSGTDPSYVGHQSPAVVVGDANTRSLGVALEFLIVLARRATNLQTGLCRITVPLKHTLPPQLFHESLRIPA